MADNSITSLNLPAPAKINLFLHIIGRRADGYHELQTVFQFVDFCDHLSFQHASKLSLTQEGPNAQDIPDEHNLVWKAAMALRAATGCTKGAAIHVDKQIPAGGGLGGGSSDAATTLLGLNKLWQLGLDIEQLTTIGTPLGADVAVFIKGYSAFAEGIGERLSPVEPPTPWYLLVKPQISVATANIFSHQELTRDTSPIKIAAFLRDPSIGHNDCLPVVRQLYPEVAQAMQWLNGFSEARLTGTGACIYAEFNSRAEAEQVQKQVPEHWTAVVAKGLNKSNCHTALEDL